MRYCLLAINISVTAFMGGIDSIKPILHNNYELP